MRDFVGSRLIKASFDELMWDLTTEFDLPDYVCSPRGNEIKEIIAPRMVLADPRNRLITAPSRKSNYGFAVGEFLWYWRGSQSLEEMVYYNKRMAAFSDDGETLNSAYGYRLKNWNLGGKPGTGQWDTCKQTLIEDSDSRRAVMLINDPRDQYRAVNQGSKDVPCTLSLQFFIRDNELHLHTNMRSNDVHWGLTYDLFSFTLFQECMLLELKKNYPELKLGRYFHTAGSLHIYERHYKMTDDMNADYRVKAANPDKGKLWFTDPMDPIESLDEIDKLQNFEKDMRLGVSFDRGLFNDKLTSPTIRWMAHQLYDHRKKREQEQKG